MVTRVVAMVTGVRSGKGFGSFLFGGDELVSSFCFVVRPDVPMKCT